MIICCGESLIDMIPTQGEATTCLTPVSGGAIFNTAISLGRLGADVSLLSGVSTDLFGEQLEQCLHDSHVKTGTLVRSNLPTTLAFVKLANGQANYTFYDENSAGRSIKPADLPKLDSNSSCLYFGGISLISTPAADSYLAFAQQHAHDHVIMLDPNIRQSFITNETLYRTRLAEFLTIADIVKVSDEDLAWLSPNCATETEQIAALSLSASAAIVVTHGEQGALLYLPSGAMVEQQAYIAEVIDTVGAGDTFNAGLLAGLWQQKLLTKSALPSVKSDQWQQALALGSRVASITVSRKGADAPWQHEL